MYLFGNGKDKKKLSYGQIATILTLIIAAVFVFAVVTLNMRRVTQRKAALDNAADGAALFLASSLGSLGNKLSHEYLNGGIEKCNMDWDLIINIGLLIGSLFLCFIIPHLGAAGTVATLLNVARSVATGIAIAAGLGLGAKAAFITAIEPKQFENFSLYFKQMTAEQQVIEGAIQYAAFSVIDDQKEVPDVNDDDGDGSTDDKILRLTQVYYQRLRDLPVLGPVISDFILQLSEFVAGREENDETWELIRVWVPDPQSPQISFAKWLWDPDRLEEDTFKDLLLQLSMRGLLDDNVYGGLTYRDFEWLANELQGEISDFEKWAFIVLYQSPDQRLVGFNQWYNQLIPDPKDPDSICWQERLERCQTLLKKLIEKLNYIQDNKVQPCVDTCGKNEWKQESCPKDPCCVDESTCLPGVTCEDTDCSACDGDFKGCCELCNDGHCPPDGNCCNTCCQIQANCDRETSKIVRAIDDHLILFQKELNDFVAYLPDFAAEVEEFKVNWRQVWNWTYPPKDSTWKWEDTAGEHKVYVAVEGLLGGKDFKGPHLVPKRNWWKLGLEKCLKLRNYAGDFNFVVSRYDNEEARGLRGILDLLIWNKTITSEAKGSYGINKTDIKIEKIR